MANDEKSIKELKIEIKGLKELIKELKENRNYLYSRIEKYNDQINAMKNYKVFNEQYYKISYTAKATEDGPPISCDDIIEAYTPQIAIESIERYLKFPGSFKLKNIEKIDI